MRVATASFLFIQSLFLSVFISHPALSEKVCVKSTSGKVICGELVPKKKKAPAPASGKKKAPVNPSGVDLTLEGCVKSREGLMCSITVYNSTDYDKNFRIYADWLPENPQYKSIIIDSEGNQYAAIISGIGSQLGPKPGIGGGFSNATLPPKIKMSARLLFRPSGRLTDNIRVFKISFEVESKQYFQTFRDFSVGGT
jgi:hypothetical protein